MQKPEISPTMTSKRTRIPILAIPDIVYGGEIWEWIVPKFPQMIVADAPDAKKDESLIELAVRMSERWSAMRLFQEFQSVVLVSFGATSALTLEALPCLMQLKIKVVACFVVSGGRNRLRWNHRQNVRLVCARLLSSESILNQLRREVDREMVDAETAKQERVQRYLARMDQVAVQHYRWTARHLRSWKPSAASLEHSVPIFQLHGRRNPMIQPPSIHEATLLLTGEHFIPWTHPEQVERWMAAIVDDLALKARSDSSAE